MTTHPTPDRLRALHLLEAADFLRDAHFRDGLTVQEIGTALRHMADEADPMVGSLAREGFGLDEIAAMPVVPPVAADRAGLRERIAEALYRHEWPHKQIWQQALAMDRETFLAQADAVLAALFGPIPAGTDTATWTAIRAIQLMNEAGRNAAVLPPAADRAAVLREAADIAQSLRQFEPATGARKPAQVSENVGILRVADELRRLADEAQDEQQAQQGGAETRDALMAAHVALAEQAVTDTLMGQSLADTAGLVKILTDLDRCRHGRHEGDPCGPADDCNGTSAGNPWLRPGMVIGHGLRGDQIVMPDRDHKHDPKAWRVQTDGGEQR
ncbi:hypothetical protein [Streptomyces turgidiscabies]|nr:hypothetical protein [Streptomyces turgidiscabies]